MNKKQKLTKELKGEVMELIETGEIVKGKALLATKNEEGEDIVVVDFKGKMAVINSVDFDIKEDLRIFGAFVGHMIYFTVIKIDEDTGLIHLSRKEAQAKMIDEVQQDLENGEEKDAIITGLLSYGAYVSVDGLHAIIKNSDYSDGYIEISEELEIGSTIKVRLRNVSEKGRIYVEPIVKVKTESLLSVNMFQEGDMVEGKVRAIKPFGAFVGIAPGVDALCNIPVFGEIEEGVRVKIRIKKIFEENREGREDNKDEGETIKRIRGKIETILI